MTGPERKKEDDIPELGPDHPLRESLGPVLRKATDVSGLKDIKLPDHLTPYLTLDAALRDMHDHLFYAGVEVGAHALEEDRTTNQPNILLGRHIIYQEASLIIQDMLEGRLQIPPQTTFPQILDYIATKLRNNVSTPEKFKPLAEEVRKDEQARIAMEFPNLDDGAPPQYEMRISPEMRALMDQLSDADIHDFLKKTEPEMDEPPAPPIEINDTVLRLGAIQGYMYLQTIVFPAFKRLAPLTPGTDAKPGGTDEPT